MRSILALAFLAAAATAARAGDLVPTDSRFGPLRVASHKVEVTVDNQIAIVRVEQVFANDHSAQLEAHYTFPVPKNASIIDFSMTVNGQLIRGELLEKQRARQIYEGIVRQSKDPGLLEHVGANIFRVRVFPIMPASQQKIEMTYVERVNYDTGLCRFVYPLLVPGGAKSTKADLFDFRLRLASVVPIKDVACLTHKANVARKAEESAEVTFEGRQIDLSRDLEVTYRIARPTSGMDLVAHRENNDPLDPAQGKDGFFMLLLTPQADAPRVPKDMTFVFDRSGSMEGKRIKQARAALKFCLAKLQPDDRFNIVTFSSDVERFQGEHVAATPGNKARAEKFVDAIDASGSTNISGAFRNALTHRAEAGRPHHILFLTDGQPTTGETDPKAIVRTVLERSGGNVRIFTFGVGKDLNRALLEDLAESTGAVAEYVAEEEDIEEKVSRLQKKIATPVLSELSIDWGGAEVSAVYPKSPGDLFAGAQLVITGRYRKAGTFEVTLKGRAGAKSFEIKEKLVFPERRDEAAGVPYLWAMRKVSALLDEIRRSGEIGEVVQEVIALAKRYRLATPYTSFLVLESEAAYDQQGIDRKGSSFTPPGQTAKGLPAPDGAKFAVTYAARRVELPYPARSLGPRDSFERKGIPKDDQASQPTDEPAIFFPEARESDHNESTDNEHYRQMRGDSKEFLSYLKGEAAGFRGRQAGSPGVFDTMGVGVGGAAGGRYGGRFGGRESLVARSGGTRATESAVLAALKWLARHQNPDGSWSAKGLPERCFWAKCSGAGEPDYDAGLTGLSLLAFMGAGYSHLSKDEYPDPVQPERTLKFGEVVKNGLKWLMSHQDPEGCIGGRGSKYMYSHAVAAQAMSEAYGMTASQLLKQPAQKAIDFLVAAQNPGKGWRYGFKCGDNDTSVTGWAAMALKSAELAELAFPKTSCDGVLTWLDQVTDPGRNHQAGYNERGTGRVFIPGKNEAFEGHPTLSAIAVLSRIHIQKDRSDPAFGATQLLLNDLPEWKDNRVDTYYWYFGSLALFQFDGPSGTMWKRWNEPLKNALIPNQKTGKDGCQSGSWDPAADRWGSEGGRVYVTAMNALTLEVYYRYANVFGATAR